VAADAPPLDGERIASAFERVPSVVERLLAAGPYASVDEVMARAERVVRELREEEQVALLDAHPRIGAPAAGLSSVSAGEQGGEADAATAAALDEANGEYEQLFGFRCVVFVAGRAKAELLPVMRARLRNDRDGELATGLAEFLAIARDRLSR